MRSRTLPLLALAIALLSGMAACNVLTGADDLEVDGTTDVGAGGASGSGASGNGAGAGSPNGTGPSAGGGSASGGAGAGPSGPECGDAICGAGEDCTTCEADCGVCPATCGNGSCDGEETCQICAVDCGECAPACGDTACNGTETCETCAADCGVCPPQCGDGQCSGGETCQACEQDCGACPPGCGDGQCNGTETCTTCQGDCGACPPMCGDGQCNGNETCATCQGDCGPCEVCGGAGPATTGLDAEEAAFLVLINDYRAQNGLGALSACTSLNRAAQGHSEDMRDQDYFSHTGLDGSSPWARACEACYDLGCGPQTAMAENIAAGNTGAQGTFTQWQNSPGHNANMLGSNFTVIGIGRATGGMAMYSAYWTNVFGGQSEASCN